LSRGHSWLLLVPGQNDALLVVDHPGIVGLAPVEIGVVDEDFGFCEIVSPHPPGCLAQNPQRS
jgi:hypothetical protein